MTYHLVQVSPAHLDQGRIQGFGSGVWGLLYLNAIGCSSEQAYEPALAGIMSLLELLF